MFFVENIFGRVLGEFRSSPRQGLGQVWLGPSQVSVGSLAGPRRVPVNSLAGPSGIGASPDQVLAVPCGVSVKSRVSVWQVPSRSQSSLD